MYSSFTKKKRLLHLYEHTIDNMKISIVIPVYQSVSYIEACLDSVCSQTMKDFEVIFVDDCGLDGTMFLVEQYLEQHPDAFSYKIVSMLENKGPAIARNAGIKEAEGEYLAFLDGDDRLSPEFCEELYRAAKEAKADIACCDISINYLGRSEVVCNPKVSSGAFTIDLHKMYLRKYVSYFTTYIYRRQFILDNDIVFPNTRSAEDSCFLCCAILAAQRIARVNKPLYMYDKHPDSISEEVSHFRGLQRMGSFKTLWIWARSHGMKAYRREIYVIALKKGLLLSLLDLITG